MKQLRALLDKERAMKDVSAQLGVQDPEIDAAEAATNRAIESFIEAPPEPCYGLAALAEERAQQ